MASYKKRQEIIQEELIEQKGNMIYVEKKIKDIIKDRYDDRSINTDSSYIYQKMDKLVAKKIYIPLWNIGHSVKQIGFINIFNLHKELGEIIRLYHLPRKSLGIYTEEERKYMRGIG